VVAIKPLDAACQSIVCIGRIAHFHNNAPNKMMGGFYHVTYFHSTFRSAKIMHAMAAIMPATLINIVICSS